MPVVVATVTQKTIPVQLSAIGDVQPYSTVSVKAQVSGELTRVYFAEGQDVQRGELLFTIDHRPFEAALRQAEANLAKDTAQAKNAEVEAQRYAGLVTKGFISQEQYDAAHATAAALAATMRADQAAVATAKLQLAYCSIRSPIDGRTGSLLVHQGNLVKANDAPLVTINQMTPIYVAFAVPEQYLAEIKRYQIHGLLKVEATIPGGSDDPQDGKRLDNGALTFIDNAVAPGTGTIQLKATFPNKTRALWPGQFVRVVLTLTSQPNTIVVPSQAIERGQTGQYVFVVKPDHTVESRPVVVSREVGTETAIAQGLHAGEQVVTDGQLRLVPGARVAIADSPSVTASTAEPTP